MKCTGFMVLWLSPTVVFDNICSGLEWLKILNLLHVIVIVSFFFTCCSLFLLFRERRMTQEDQI